MEQMTKKVEHHGTVLHKHVGAQQHHGSVLHKHVGKHQHAGVIHHRGAFGAGKAKAK